LCRSNGIVSGVIGRKKNPRGGMTKEQTTSSNELKNCFGKNGSEHQDEEPTKDRTNDSVKHQTYKN